MLLVAWTCSVLFFAGLLTTIRWCRRMPLTPKQQWRWEAWERSLWGGALGALIFYFVLHHLENR
jgi:hypothetical protein